MTGRERDDLIKVACEHLEDAAAMVSLLLRDSDPNLPPRDAPAISGTR